MTAKEYLNIYLYPCISRNHCCVYKMSWRIVCPLRSSEYLIILCITCILLTYGSCATATSIVDYRRCSKRVLISLFVFCNGNMQVNIERVCNILVREHLHHWKGNMSFFNIVVLEVLDIRYNFTFLGGLVLSDISSTNTQKMDAAGITKPVGAPEFTSDF